MLKKPTSQPSGNSSGAIKPFITSDLSGKLTGAGTTISSGNTTAGLYATNRNSTFFASQAIPYNPTTTLFIGGQLNTSGQYSATLGIEKKF